MKSYLKENYPWKLKVNSLTTLIITKVIYVSIWIVSYMCGHLVERNWLCITAGIERSISVGTRG
jgi:hypothetical protein